MQSHSTATVSDSAGDAEIERVTEGREHGSGDGGGSARMGGAFSEALGEAVVSVADANGSSCSGSSRRGAGRAGAVGHGPKQEELPV